MTDRDRLFACASIPAMALFLGAVLCVLSMMVH